jgi:hypothetical protein
LDADPQPHADADMERVTVGVDAGVFVCEKDRLMDRDAVMDLDNDMETELVGVPLGSIEGLGSFEDVYEGVADAVSEPLGVAELVGVTLGVRELVLVTVGLRECVRDNEMLTVRVSVPDALSDGEGLTLLESLIEREGVALAVTVTEDVKVMLPDPDVVAVGETVEVREALLETVLVREEEGDTVLVRV